MVQTSLPDAVNHDAAILHSVANVWESVELLLYGCTREKAGILRSSSPRTLRTAVQAWLPHRSYTPVSTGRVSAME